MTSLFEATGNIAAEREAIAQPERPGRWYGDYDADARMLTQHETDTLIRLEIWNTRPEQATDELAKELLDALGGLAVLLPPECTDAAGQLRAMLHQRGGIDSDPLVRLLAFRTWGDRDRRWFELRGVRKNEHVTVAEQVGVARPWPGAVARPWPGEIPYAVALDDASPGERVPIKIEGTAPGIGEIWSRAGDRLRVPDPVQAVQELYGFDELSLDRDPVNRCTVITVSACQRRHSTGVADRLLLVSRDPSDEVWTTLDALAHEVGLEPPPRQQATASERARGFGLGLEDAAQRADWRTLHGPFAGAQDPKLTEVLQQAFVRRQLRYDPDPYGMGLVADLRCVGCQRDRSRECVSSDEADVLQGAGVCEIKGVPCICGATLIRNGWLVGSPHDDDSYG